MSPHILPKRSWLLAVATALAAGISSSPARADSFWLQPVSGNWPDPTKWSNNIVPGSDPNFLVRVFIEPFGPPFVVSLDEAAYLYDLYVGPGATLVVTGPSASLNVNHMTTLQNATLVFDRLFGLNTSITNYNSTLLFTGDSNDVIQNMDWGAVPLRGRVDLGSGATIHDQSLYSSAGEIGIFPVPNSTAPVTLRNNFLSGANLVVHANSTLAVSEFLVLNNGTISVGDTAGPATLVLERDAAFLFTPANITFAGVSPSTLTLTGNPQNNGTGISSNTPIRTGAGGGVINATDEFGTPSVYSSGIISAETPGKDIEIQSDFFNDGIAQAINGATLHIDRLTTSNGSITAGPGSVVTIAGSPTYNFNLAGVIFVDGGTVNLTGGTLAAFVPPHITHGGVLNFISGQYDMAGISLDSTSSAIFHSTQTTSGLPEDRVGVIDGAGNLTVRADANVTQYGGISANSLTIGGVLSQLRLDGAKNYSIIHNLTIDHTGQGTTAVYTGVLAIVTVPLILQAPDANAKAAMITRINEAAFAGHNGTNNTYSDIRGISTSVAFDTRFVLGIYDNAALHSLTDPSQPRTDWAGGIGNVDSNSILITPALKGDANLDGIVDIADMVVIANNWNLAGLQDGISTLDMAHGDVNLDGVVDIADMVVVANNWNQTSSFSLSPAPSPVPEPAALALFTLGSACLLRRRVVRASINRA